MRGAEAELGILRCLQLLKDFLRTLSKAEKYASNSRERHENTINVRLNLAFLLKVGYSNCRTFLYLRVWRNWQTRTVQVRMSFGS